MIRSARRVAGLLAAIGFLGLTASSATAAVRAGSQTFDPNPPGPTFGNPSRLPLINIAVSYDDQAGTITVTESGGDPSYFTGWAYFDRIQIGGSNTPDVDISGEWNYPSYPSIAPILTETSTNGSLTPQMTKSPDGSTITAVWTSPVLANQNLSFVNIAQSSSPDNNCSCDTEPSGSFYFPGYTPYVLVTSPGAQTTKVGTGLGTGFCSHTKTSNSCCPFPRGPAPCPSVDVAAAEIGLANSGSGDPSAIASASTKPADAYSATGLPPGLRIDRAGTITGTPTQAGTYSPNVTATAGYNNGAQTAAGSTTFSWVITPKPLPPVRHPLLPVFLGAPYHGKGLQAKPYVIVYTGDGTGAFGGPGRPTRRFRIGRLRWTKWTLTEGLGKGDNWLDNCTPDCAAGLRTPYPITLKADWPMYVHGHEVFTRLTVTYTKKVPRFQHRRSYTMKLAYQYGGFTWK